MFSKGNLWLAGKRRRHFLFELLNATIFTDRETKSLSCPRFSYALVRLCCSKEICDTPKKKEKLPAQIFPIGRFFLQEIYDLSRKQERGISCRQFLPIGLEAYYVNVFERKLLTGRKVPGRPLLLLSVHDRCPPRF